MEICLFDDFFTPTEPVMVAFSGKGWRRKLQVLTSQVGWAKPIGVKHQENPQLILILGKCFAPDELLKFKQKCYIRCDFLLDFFLNF